MSNELEEGRTAHLDFDKVAKIGRAGHQVVPVVLQDADSGEVLFIGYANEEAYLLTLERRSAVLYSTSWEEIWHKGATSGDELALVDVRVNCEQNSLLYRVRKAGQGVCHTKDAVRRDPPDLLLPHGGRSRRARVRLTAMQTWPDLDEFRRLATDHRVVPVWREVLADLTTPVSAFARVVGDDDGFLLESVEGGDRWSRWSFIGRRPHGTLVSRDGRLTVVGDLGIDVPLDRGCSWRSTTCSSTTGPPRSRDSRRCTEG
ncbi:MAG: phosphoribosyl-AMP cyclohydrolase [Acidimicrobiales bacterium]